MVVRRDSLRAQTDFFSPMTGNTSPRLASAPRGKYGEEVKSRMAGMGEGGPEIHIFNGGFGSDLLNRLQKPTPIIKNIEIYDVKIDTKILNSFLSFILLSSLTVISMFFSIWQTTPRTTVSFV